jgi:hypothetical protein
MQTERRKKEGVILCHERMWAYCGKNCPIVHFLLPREHSTINMMTSIFQYSISHLSIAIFKLSCWRKFYSNLATAMLKSSLLQFDGRHHELDRYEISISQMAMDVPR